MRANLRVEKREDPSREHTRTHAHTHSHLEFESVIEKKGEITEKQQNSAEEAIHIMSQVFEQWQREFTKEQVCLIFKFFE